MFTLHVVLPGIGRARYGWLYMYMYIVIDQTFASGGVWTCAHTYSLIIAAQVFFACLIFAVGGHDREIILTAKFSRSTVCECGIQVCYTGRQLRKVRWIYMYSRRLEWTVSSPVFVGVLVVGVEDLVWYPTDQLHISCVQSDTRGERAGEGGRGGEERGG